jgi:hypothetical protein
MIGMHLLLFMAHLLSCLDACCETIRSEGIASSILFFATIENGQFIHAIL